MSVFISWSGADRDVKNVIASKLAEENIPYWDSDEHCKSDFSQECIENIHRSSVFVVIVSEASMAQGSYVFNEVIEARRMESEGRLNILVYKLTDAPYTDRFSMQLNHISDANCLSRVQGLGKAGGIESLLKRIKLLLSRREEGNPEKPYDVLLPQVVGMPVTAGGYFVPDSRNDILEALEEAFSSSNVVILSKLFGFGKKSVIRRYIAATELSSVVEVQGMNEPLRRFFLDGLHFSNVNDHAFESTDEEAVIRAKFELLKKLDGRHVIIVSDVSLEDEADRTLCTRLSDLRCRMVLITQSSAEDYRDYFPVINVGRMESRYLRELFFHYYDRDGGVDRAPLIPALDRFFEDVGGHTKTVEVAASVLSREMRARPEELINYLTSGSDHNRTLDDRIVERLSELIVMEDFSEEVKETLILIALLADPVIEEAELLRMMKLCGLSHARVLTELESHRWITCDARNQTVYIEPIIAQICIARLLDGYRIPTEIFSDLHVRQWPRLVSMDSASVAHFFARIERFFRLLHMDEAADVFRMLRTESATSDKDVGRAEALCARFENWYCSMREEIGDTPTERDQFALSAALWVKVTLLPTLKTSLLYSSMYALGTSQRFSMKSYGELLDDMIGDVADDPMALEVLERIADEGKESDSSEVGLLYQSILQSFLSRDIPVVSKSVFALLDYIEREPELFASEETSDQLLLIARMIHQCCVNMGAYQTAIAIFERLIALPWKSRYLHRNLMLYASLLFCVEDAASDAVAVMMAADELMEEIAEDPTLSREVRENMGREHAVLFARALAAGGDIEAAIGQLEKLRLLGESAPPADHLSAIDAVITQMLRESRGNEVAGFVDDCSETLAAFVEDERLSEAQREKAEAFLAMREFYASGTQAAFSAGGIVTDKSYYQRYSMEKKNGLLTMMPYNRIAKEVARFDFSAATEEELLSFSARLRARAAAGEDRKRLAAEAFALVSEAGFRTLGYRHHFVQYVGAAAMLDGKIAEILNGEGKTYTLALVAYVNSLYYGTVFVLDDSKYLTERNYKWMRGLYTLLGCRVRYLSPRESDLPGSELREMNIIYSDFATFGFNFLYGETGNKDHRLDLSACCALVDEADSVLIESACTPITVTRRVRRSDNFGSVCQRAFGLAEQIRGDARYYSVKARRVELKQDVYPLIEEAFSLRREELSSAEEVSEAERLVRLALSCLELSCGEDYYIRGDVILEEDPRTGGERRIEGERGYFLSLIHQIHDERYEADLLMRRDVVNVVHVYSLLKKLGAVAGASATASSFKKEFKEIYGFEVVAIPTVQPIQRTDESVTLFLSNDAKERAIADMVEERHGREQPVLLIVSGLRESARYSHLLTERGIPHKVLNAKNSEKSPELLATAGILGSVLIATKLANRGVDIKLGGDAERMTLFELVERGVDLSRIDEILYTLPNEELRESDLYRIYTATLEQKRALVAANKRRVIEAGGLCVIGTEPHYDMRIEQQIRGRAGRQGEIGESYIFESIDDEMFRLIFANRYGDMLRSYYAGSDLEIVDSRLLKGRIEKFKERMHHSAFRRMSRAAAISRRTEDSKRDFLERIESIGNESLEEVDVLLDIWVTDSANTDVIQSLLWGEKPKMKGAVTRLCERFPEILEQDFETLEEYLSYAAERYWETAEIDLQFLGALLRFKWEMHASAMQELEMTVDLDSLKNSEATLAQMYREDHLKKLSEAVDLWIYNTL